MVPGVPSRPPNRCPAPRAAGRPRPAPGRPVRGRDRRDRPRAAVRRARLRSRGAACPPRRSSPAACGPCGEQASGGGECGKGEQRHIPAVGDAAVRPVRAPTRGCSRWPATRSPAAPARPPRRSPRSPPDEQEAGPERGCDPQHPQHRRPADQLYWPRHERGCARRSRHLSALTQRGPAATDRSQLADRSASRPYRPTPAGAGA